MDELGEDRVYMSIASAVTDFERRWPRARSDVRRATRHGTTQGD
jgi:hypothetical protein